MSQTKTSFTREKHKKSTGGRRRGRPTKAEETSSFVDFCNQYGVTKRRIMVRNLWKKLSSQEIKKINETLSDFLEQCKLNNILEPPAERYLLEKKWNDTLVSFKGA